MTIENYVNIFGNVDDMGNNALNWEPLEETNGAEQILLSKNAGSGGFTRLVRFLPNSSTLEWGAIFHEHMEEVLVLRGSIFDQNSRKWLQAGDYVVRPEHTFHGPFIAHDKEGCLLLDITYMVERKQKAF